MRPAVSRLALTSRKRERSILPLLSAASRARQSSMSRFCGLEISQSPPTQVLGLGHEHPAGLLNAQWIYANPIACLTWPGV